MLSLSGQSGSGTIVHVPVRSSNTVQFIKQRVVDRKCVRATSKQEVDVEWAGTELVGDSCLTPHYLQPMVGKSSAVPTPAPRLGLARRWWGVGERRRSAASPDKNTH